MNIPLSFGHYNGRSGAANANECVNMMVEPDQQGGSASYTLQGTPGCKEYVDLQITSKGRGGFSMPGATLAVVGQYLFLISTASQTAANIGQLDTTSGFVQFAENPTQVMLIDGTYGYVYTKATQSIAKITDPDFPTPKACTFKDGYGVVVEEDTGKFYVSAINDFTSWDALDFTTAEFEPDNLVGCIANHDSLFAFGEETTQAYYNSGDSSYPFNNRAGASMMIGCGATNSIAVGNNIIFWLDNHGVVRNLSGYVQQIISTFQINDIISGFSTFSDATGHTYTQNGHVFYVLTFPTEKVTLVYDLTTQQWHKRTSGALSGRYRPAWIVQEDNLILAGDFYNGKIYELDLDTHADDGKEQVWLLTTQNVNSDRKKIAHTMLELHIEAGVGGEDNETPYMWMQYSDDDGNTWSREKWASMGKIGEFSTRIRWYSLGQSRSRTYRFGGSDAVKRRIISAHLEGQVLAY